MRNFRFENQSKIKKTPEFKAELEIKKMPVTPSCTSKVSGLQPHCS